MTTFPLSAMLTSLPLDFEPALAQVARLGFAHVDVVALVERPVAHREALAASGLYVACAALGRNLPEGCGLDVASLPARRQTLDALKRQVDDAALLGAIRAYVVPGSDASPEALLRFADTLALLAEFAASRMVRLCLEPVPKRTLASAAGTLDWLEERGLVGVRLLLDVGHCLISGEDAAAVVRRAGPRLGHVHLDDNDGVGDLHWPLFTGKLTRDDLARFLAALDAIDYDGPLAFEFNPSLPDPLDALRQGRLHLSEPEAI